MRIWPALLLCASLAAAPPKTTKTQIRIPVWSDSGQPLAPDSLVVKLDGAPVPIVQLRGPGDELMVLLVLDMVGDLASVDMARDALVKSIGELPSNAYVGILRAQDGLRVLLDPSADRGASSKVIETLSVSGRAGLLDTVETASQLAGSILAKAAVRVALCYVTDSNIYNYREDFTNPAINPSDSRDLSRRFGEGLVRDRITKLSAKLSALEAPLFLVHLDYRADRMNEAYQNGLLQLASTTGGTALFCRSNAEIPTAISKMFQFVSSLHTVDLLVPNTNGGPTVQIVVESGSRSLNYRSRFLLRER